MNKGSSTSVNPASFSATPSATGAPINLLPAGGGGATNTLNSLGPSRSWMDFITQNQNLIGGIIGGVGSGLLSQSQADAQQEALLERDRERRAAIDRNFSGLNKGLLTGRGDVDDTPRPTPTERFDPVISGSRYVYDPSKGQIVQTQPQPAAA